MRRILRPFWHVLYKLASSKALVLRAFLPRVFRVCGVPIRLALSYTLRFLAYAHYYLFGFDRTNLMYQGLLKGGMHKNKKLCILVLYEVEKIPLATIENLKELMRQNFHMLLVVNGALSKDFRETLLRHAHVLCVRANYGLDFAGYQVGLAYASKEGWLPCDVLLMNNTCFFPVRPTQDFWKRLYALQTSVKGVTSDPVPFFHLQSYFLLFSKNVISMAVFCEFWRSYIPAHSKIVAIRNGEQGINNFFHLNNIQIQSAYSSKELDELGKGIRNGNNAIFYLPSSLCLNLGIPFFKKASFYNGFISICDAKDILKSYWKGKLLKEAVHFLEEMQCVRKKHPVLTNKFQVMELWECWKMLRQIYGHTLCLILRGKNPFFKHKLIWKQIPSEDLSKRRHALKKRI